MCTPCVHKKAGPVVSSDHIPMSFEAWNRPICVPHLRNDSWNLHPFFFWRITLPWLDVLLFRWNYFLAHDFNFVWKKLPSSILSEGNKKGSLIFFSCKETGFSIQEILLVDLIFQEVKHHLHKIQRYPSLINALWILPSLAFGVHLQSFRYVHC